MPLNHAELVAALDALQAALPSMIEEYPDTGDFWNAFAGQADVIEAGDETAYVNARIDAMLVAQGIAQEPFTRTAPDLQAMLDLLGADVPKMIAAHDFEGGFWCEFDARADRIEESTDPGDMDTTRQRIEAMLLANGKDPASDVPCDG